MQPPRWSLILGPGPSPYPQPSQHWQPDPTSGENLPWLPIAQKSEKMKVLATQSCFTLCDPMNCIAHQAPLSMEFSRQEYWNGLPFPCLGDLPDPRSQPGTCHGSLLPKRVVLTKYPEGLKGSTPAPVPDSWDFVKLTGRELLLRDHFLGSDLGKGFSVLTVWLVFNKNVPNTPQIFSPFHLSRESCPLLAPPV